MSTDHQWVSVDFEKAELHNSGSHGARVLTVTGNTPSSSVRGCPIKLVPATYSSQPEYWRVEVLWDRADAIFQSICPFEASVPIDDIRGTKGIEVVGKTRVERLPM